ncbi:MAG: hypothetical protein MUF54_18645 [Polyangiaceae bacterium]|jgi:hypothetical protein|nr:hypothetical protein [Polyangiaceae bacterium]
MPVAQHTEPFAQDNCASDRAATGIVLAYVGERAEATLCSNCQLLAYRVQQLETELEVSRGRTAELEKTVAHLTAYSQELQVAYEKMRLGLCRHRSDHVPSSELQQALEFPQPADAPVPASQPADPADPGLPVPPGETTTQTSGETGDDSKPPRKRHRHGRCPLSSLPRVVIEIFPPQVLLSGLENYEQIGAEESSVIGFRRGGPVEIVDRRLKFVAKPLRSDAQTASVPAVAESVAPESACDNTAIQSEQPDPIELTAADIIDVSTSDTQVPEDGDCRGLPRITWTRWSQMS